VEFEKSAELFRQMPGVVLVDPAYIAGAGGGTAFDEIVACLPAWALPVIVAGEGSAPYLGAVRARLEKSYTSQQYRPDAVRRGLRGVSSLREFCALIPFLVSRAEREYLRHGPIRASVRKPAFRPRLAGGRPANLPVKETPDV
jgi:hypothetical protein